MEKELNKINGSAPGYLSDEHIIASICGVGRLELPPGILPRVLGRLEEEGRLALKRKKIQFAILALVTFSVLCYSWAALISEILSRGMLDLLYILISDFKVIAAYWYDFIMYFLETLPVGHLLSSAALTLATMLITRKLGRLSEEHRKFIIKHNSYGY